MATLTNSRIKAIKKKAGKCLKAQQYHEAKALYDDICRLDRRNTEAWFVLGAINGQLGLYDECVYCCRKVVSVDPDNAGAHYNLAQAYINQCDVNSAITHYQEVIRIAPQHVDALSNLGYAHKLLKQFPQAEKYFSLALAIKPDHEDALNNLGNVLHSLGRPQDGIKALRSAVNINPTNTKARISLALSFHDAGLLDEASKHIDYMLKLDPGNQDAQIAKAMTCEKRGDLDEAFKILTPLSDLGLQDGRFILVYAKISKRFNRQEDAINRLEVFLKTNTDGKVNTESLHLQLGKMYEERGNYDQAFTHYKLGNPPPIKGTDPFIEQMNELMQFFTKKFLSSAPISSITSEQPVFIVGMPRSGTTLVEQILASHPEAYGAGELEGIKHIRETLPHQLETDTPYPKCLKNLTQTALDKAATQYLNQLPESCKNTPRVADKMPHNFLHLGLISLLFPKSRIIHCRRNPLDTCLSIYTSNFNASHTYATDLILLGDHYNHYVKMMEHWTSILEIPIHEIQYERLVADQELVTRELIEFCGLTWNAQCLHFHTNKRTVSTISYDQVRQPMYTKSINRWKQFETRLGPLKESLKDVLI